MKRILVIDDEEQICEMLHKKLESVGYEVEAASNGKIGLKLHKQNPFDLIISDIFMPEKEGLETIREFRQDFPELKIIAMTGGYSSGPNELLDVARMLGADRTFPKPFKLKEIVETIKGLIGEV
ncbi:MAG: response regulator [Candidatus Aminicenantes bacterium]|nr:response regulator [Candidatus Aminicenantes bacterium]